MALRLRQIASVVATACLCPLIVAGLAACSTTLHAPKTAVRTGTVRTSALKKMEALNMDRSAPILIRIYKEESAL